MAKVSKKAMKKLLKKGKSSSEAYPWIRVPRPEGIPVSKKTAEMNELLRNVRWLDPRFGPNAID